MATPPKDPDYETSEELDDYMVEHHRATIEVQQAYERRLARLQQNNEEVKSLLRGLQETIEENEKDSEKSEANLEHCKNEEANLRKRGEKYKERLFQRLQGDEGEKLQKELKSLEEKNIQLQLQLKDQTQLVSQSFKEKSAMTMKNDEKDRQIKTLTDETQELRQKIELLQQQLEKEENEEEEPDSEATQFDDQHTERGIYNCMHAMHMHFFIFA